MNSPLPQAGEGGRRLGEGVIRWLLLYQLKATSHSLIRPNGHLLPREGEESSNVFLELKSRKLMKLTDIIKYLQVFVYWTDNQLRYQGCNQLFARAMGLTSENEIKTRSIKLFPNYQEQSNLLEIINKNNRHVLETGETTLFEENFLYNGIKTTMLSQKIPLQNSASEITGLINLSLNIDNYKRKEQKRVNEALKSKIVLDNLLDNIPGHVYWKDRHGIYLGCNDRQAQSLGLHRGSEVVGKTDFELPWDAQSAQKFWENDLWVLETGKAKTVEEIAMVYEQPVTLLSLKVPLKDVDGLVTGVLGISIDISKQKKAEEKLIQAKEAAEAANKAKTDFLENMRHDIRTPLVGITGCASTIKDIIDDPKRIEEVKEYADNLETSGHALNNLLNEVLETITLASDEIPLVKKKFDLKEKLLNIVNLNQSKANQKHLKLSLQHDDRIPHYLMGDSNRIQRMILELVTNALNFTDKGSIKISTELIKQNKNDIVIKIKVEDTGIGIEPDKQQEVFTRFKRLTPSCEGIYKGTGLGLALVKQFIDDLEGEIYLESQPQSGSVFTCVLPLKVSLLDEALGADTFNLELKNLRLTQPENKTSIKNAKPSSKILNHILLVEDDTIAAKVTESFLNSFNCKVDIARDGKSALQFSNAKEYDLIFLDVGLPDISGDRVATQIRAGETKHNRYTPIIALTAHVDVENKGRCLNAGIDKILSKPLLKETALNILNIFIPKPSKHQNSKPHLEKQSELLPLPEQVIDLELGACLMGDELELAKKTIKMLIDSLPAVLTELQKAYEDRDWEILEKRVHKFYSGVVYCGTPRLKVACVNLETYLKSNQTKLRDVLYKQLLQEIFFLKDEYESTQK